MMRELVTIDGSQGEGGGQILRTSLSLSAIRGQPFRLENIRAGREKPGLKRQHLTCIKAVAEICNARYSEIDVGSSELEFIPGEIKAGSYRFDVGTAGSVTLVAQTVIPVLLKADAPSTVVITGGTHVPHAPIWEFFEKCYLPELSRMGVRIEAEMVQPGFYPAAGGVVKLKVWPLRPEAQAEAYELTDLGAYKGGSVVGVVSNLPRSIAEAETGIVGGQLCDLELKREVREVDSFGPGNYCYVRLNFEKGVVVLSSVGTHERSRKAVANDVVHAVHDFLKSRKACEKHLADQLLVPLWEFYEPFWDPECECLEYEWTLDVQKETLHYRTNQDIIRAMIY